MERGVKSYFNLKITDDTSERKWAVRKEPVTLSGNLHSGLKQPKLLDQVREALRTRHYSYSTEKTYVHWIRQFVLFHGKRHPNKLGEAEINQFISNLALQRNVSSSTQNQALCAIVFLYKHVLKREHGDFGDLVWAKKPKRIPVVFTKE